MNVLCACFIEYDSVAELETLDWDSLPKPIRQIGSGSNLLFTGNFPGTLLHSNIKYIKYVDMGLDEVPVMVGAGVLWDDFVDNTCKAGMWGAENLSLIPGEVGAAAVQNIGAYGVEVKDLISGVVCYDLQEKKRLKFSAADCHYAYRDSFFKQSAGRYVVTSVLFRLSRIPKPRLEYKGLKEALHGPQNADSSLQTIREAVKRIRKEKLPDPAEIGSAGSFFKNPVVSAAKFAQLASGYDTVPHYLLESGFVKVPAAWLIEQCGLKGFGIGGAEVYRKQPLVIVNASGSAKPEDIVSLCRYVQSCVRDKFEVELTPEVEFIP